MQTRKETGQLMQCECHMVGFGVEVGKPTTFRDRTFLVTSKDNENEAHKCRFTWDDADGRSRAHCLA